MTPLIPIAAGGLGLWYLFGSKKQPTPSDFQVTQVTGANGVPIKIATPIPKTVTPTQKSGISIVPPRSPGAAKTTTQTGTTSAPAGSIVQTGPGSFQVPPIVITPSGASSVAISAVPDIQRALNALGFKPPLKEDGQLGPATIANIKQFQSKSGLVVDGNAGPTTKASLSSALTALAAGGSGAKAGEAATQAQTSGTLSAAPPMSSRDIQHALNLLGTSPSLVEDGALGPKSIAAIKSFQLSHGLVADGVAGAKTKIALQAAITMGPPTATPAVAGEMGAFSCGWS
jgi:peptidoglycan hydrolase-like protein with peptidoglycan-binding domain